jgi:hypothetical protein
MQGHGGLSEAKNAQKNRIPQSALRNACCFRPESCPLGA